MNAKSRTLDEFALDTPENKQKWQIAAPLKAVYEKSCTGTPETGA